MKPDYFLLGIGGSGMSTLANLLVDAGFRVAGYDQNIKSQAVINLINRGVRVSRNLDLPHDSSQTIVYSSAFPVDRGIVAELRKGQFKILHRSEVLFQLMSKKPCQVTVAGTHGKTTTTALISWMLKKMNREPSIYLGGTFINDSLQSGIAKGGPFVAEVDESDGSFLQSQPDIAVLTNVDKDHLDHYGTFTELKKAFAKYLNRTSKLGTAVIGWDDPHIREVTQHYQASKLTYGFPIGADVRALGYSHSGDFTVFKAIVEKDQVDCRIPLLGMHNIMNALAAITVSRVLGLNVQEAAETLEDFPGVTRRMNLIYQSEHIRIFDDYAHNPGKIRACLEALRDRWPREDLTVIFQAHRYSRLRDSFDEFSGAFTAASKVYVVPIFGAGEEIDSSLNQQRLAKSIADVSGAHTNPFDSLEDLTTYLKKEKTKGTLVSIGAGDITQVARQLGDYLENKEQKSKERNASETKA